jgi:diketogulonate reductase-like aldo/keto reductase
MMGADPRRRRGEAAALRLGLDLGMTLVDTAEMYAEGGAEEVVADAIAGRREEVFLVTKVLPQNASREGTLRAAERSLRRLRTDRIDLYLLHWEGAHPLEETFAAFDRLRREGKILHHGVSNFDTADMERAEALPGGAAVASNQVLYNLTRRGIERRLLPWCVERGIVVMAYTPLESGRLARGEALWRVARRRGATPAQVALAWTLRLPGVAAIPKAATAAHVRENAAAADLRLDREDLADLDAAHPAPDRDVPLETA